MNIKEYLRIKIVFLFLLSFIYATANVTEREINAGWKFRQARMTNWYPATVPGVIHTDLLANKLIEDPFFRLNERDQQWIDKEDWIYETYFDVDNTTLGRSNILLHFYGLDTYADVYLNEELILKADNMFREWKVDVKGKLKEKGNQLHIYFHSPIKIDIPKFDSYPYRYQTGPDQSQQGGIFNKTVSPFARKAGYHYGWDWGPRFVTSGIWRPAVLESWDDLRIENVYIRQKEITTKKAVIRNEVEVSADRDISGAKITVKDNSAGTVLGTVTADLKKGQNIVPVDFTINNPRLWWCNGLGEPNLYTFRTEVSAGKSITDNNLTTTGLRSVKLVSEEDKDGSALYIELNGIRVFAKGANYIPQDNFLPRVTPDRYERTILDAVNVNMNMLRVWGGGTYESDLFYELCDKHGIMVWQDFMFACSLYPSEGQYLESVKYEAIDNIKRLRNHPSIALWCGNNEAYYFWYNWDMKKHYADQNPEYAQVIWRQYTDLFHKLLPDMVAEYHSESTYRYSSPYGYPGEADSPTHGDRHYWGIWHGQEPTYHYNEVKSRFFSEYGFQSFPELESVKIFAPNPEDWNITSEVMMAHQRAGNYANPRIAEYLKKEYKEPNSFEGFLYMSQILQGDAIKIAIEAHRRAMPYCMGTLFWQHNDCWPVASWASRDYYNRWKAQHYYSRDAYRDILVSPIIDGDKLDFYIVSDRLKETKGELKIKVIKLDGTEVNSRNQSVTIPANTSTNIYSADVISFLKGAARNEVLVYVTFDDSDGKVYANRYFPALQKDIDFPKVNISRKIQAVEGGYEVTLQSDKLARAVMLSIDGIDNFFEDNYFDILPGTEVKVKVTTPLSRSEFEKQLKVTSFRDYYS